MSTENEPIAAVADVTADPPSLIESAGVAVETPPAEVVPETPPEPEKEPAKEEPPFVFTDENVKMPEGFEVDPAMKSEFITLANEHKISPQAVEALVGLQAKLAKSGAEANAKAWTDMQTAWRGEVQADPNIGGDKLDGVLSNVAKLVDKYGSDDLRQVMTLTGAGNNIHVVTFLNKMAKDLVEASPVVGAPVSAPSSLADSLFTTMKKG